jgi:hypothetical protein
MSELKVILATPHPKMKNACDGAIEVYLKSEADAVIAELKADYKEACDRLQTANLIKDEQLAATRHSKYKRCLDKANYWVAVSYQCVDDKHRRSAERHHRKWLELAKKFKDKEAK